MIEELAGPDHQDRLGHADSFFAGSEIQSRRISFRNRVAAIHGMGIDRGVPLPSPVSRLFELASQRFTCFEWVAGPRGRGSFWRLFSDAGDRNASSDLVGGYGGQSSAERIAGLASGRCKLSVKFRSSRSSGLEFVLRQQCAPRTQWSLNLNYQTQRRTISDWKCNLRSTGKCSLRFSPALSLRARITGVRLNGRALPFHIEANSSDQHVTVNLPIMSDQNTIEIQMKNNFELGVTSTLPELGGTSHGLRVLSESWSPKRDTLTLLLSGASGESYELSAWNPEQISSIEGARA